MPVCKLWQSDICISPQILAGVQSSTLPQYKGSRGDHLLIGISLEAITVSEISQGLYGCNNINDSDHWDSMEANGV